MANVVEIVVQGNDQTGRAFRTATENTRRLNTDMKAFGTVVGQTGNIVAAFGNTHLAGAINSIESGVIALRGFHRELDKSRAALIGVGAIGAGVGFSLAQLVPSGFLPSEQAAKNASETVKYLEALQATQNARLLLTNAEEGALNLARQDISTRIAQAQAMKLDAASVANLVNELTSLGQVQADAITEKFSEKAAELERNKLVLLQNTLIEGARIRGEDREADIIAEQVRFQKQVEQMRALEQAGLDSRTLIELETQNHYGRLAVIEKRYFDQRVADERRATALRLASQQRYAEGTATIAQNLATAAQAFGKKGFAAFKAFRIVEAIASTYAGAARALADWPWPYSLAVAASVVAAGIANVATIAALKPQGQAHSGLDFVPADSTFLLQRGERVVQRDQNERLTDFLEGTTGAGQATQVNIYLDGEVIGRGLGRMSKDGRLEISARAIV